MVWKFITKRTKYKVLLKSRDILMEVKAICCKITNTEIEAIFEVFHPNGYWIIKIDL